MLTQAALLSAAAVVLSILESFIPEMPFTLPGMKIGLGNIAVLLAVEICPLSMVLYVALVRSLFTLITRGATAFFMSFAGALASSLVMYFTAHLKKPRIGCLGMGISGAFSHNTAQLVAAYFIIGNTAFAYLPAVSFFSLFSGALTGLVHYFVLANVTKLSFFH